MARPIDPLKLQARLKTALQKAPAGAIERLAASALGALLGVEVAVAKSGFQFGADGGTSGRQGRRLRVECKKYEDSTSLSERELLGELDHAVARDPALEAWILVATREVTEGLEQSLTHKGESVGVPVVILDFKADHVSSLSALCSFVPDLVKEHISESAAEIARQLWPSCDDAIGRLRRDLSSWSLGFEALRSRSVSMLGSIWSSPRQSNAALAQNVAGGAVAARVRRASVHEALDSWWANSDKADAPAALVGLDGVGKTWMSARRGRR
jgi:hypothetical protein